MAWPAMLSDGTDANRELNRLRNGVFDDCLDAAKLAPGLFSLTVPTGGGKTLAAMAFALSHAQTHWLRRVIVVIPFLSIIEQNAKEYRRILGDDVVLEHHSAVPPRTDAEEEEKCAAELATENWDAPIIVTTSVQFLESLFADSPAKCRKLHRIARSVVILDEVQTLPAHLSAPARAPRAGKCAAQAQSWGLMHLLQIACLCEAARREAGSASPGGRIPRGFRRKAQGCETRATLG